MKYNSKHKNTNSIGEIESIADKLTFTPNKKISEKVFWTLPASKSHFIRWLFVSAQTPTETYIGVKGKIGTDILSCARVLEKLGVRIKKYENYWIIKGCKKGGFNPNPELLDCGNSATTFRFLSFLVCRNGINARITGDESLITRNFEDLFEILRKGGVVIEKESESIFPVSFSGYFRTSNINTPTQKTSQILSGLILSMPSSIDECVLLTEDKIISKPYFQLSVEIAKKSGAKIIIGDKKITIFSWIPIIKNKIKIPFDESLLIMPLLYSKVHDLDVFVSNWNDDKDILNNQFLFNYSLKLGLMLNKTDNGLLISNFKGGEKFQLNIEDNIDLLTPLVILMSLSKGGIISGFEHAINKESDRVKSTIYLAKSFGLKIDLGEDLKIFESKISIPETNIFSFNDHRFQMTAMILLTYTGGKIDSKNWYCVTDPLFYDKVTALK